jgi:hypothetical protein
MQTPASPRPPSAAAPEDLKKQANTWLLISLASSVLCVSLCLGIGGALFCYLALQSLEHGLLADAEAKLRWGKIITLVGSVLGVLTTTISLILRG